MNGSKRTFVSKRKLTTGRCEYRKWSEWESGDFLIGTYQSSSIDNYDKPNWHIKVEEASFTDKKAAKKLIGKVIGLNSAGKLDKAMEKVEEGEMIQVMYNGTSEMEGGKFAGKDAHDIEVDLVEEEGDGEEEETEEEESEEEDL